MSGLISWLNSLGDGFVLFTIRMLIQSSVLILILLLLDFVLRRRVRAVVRYWIWLLVLAKFLLPPSLSSPTSLVSWIGGRLPETTIVSFVPPSSYVAHEAVPPAEPTPTEATSSPVGANDHSPGPAVAQIPAPPAPSPVPVQPVVLPTWRALVLLAWVAAVILMVVLLIQRVFFVRALLAQSQEAPDALSTLLEQCRRSMGVHGVAGVRLTGLSASPSVCGLLRPVILMPEPMARQLDTPQLRSVLLHELAHIQRGDLWINLLQTLLQIVYLYHPLLWLANARIRAIREQAVDEAVLAALGEDAEEYPRTLLSISKLAFGTPSLSLRLLGVVESKRALAARIRHMVSRPFPRNARLGLLHLAAVAVIAAVLLPMARGREGRAPISSSAKPTDSSAAVSGDRLTVELLGVREYQGTGKPWWRADGTPASNEDFPEFKTTDPAYHDPNACVRVLAVCLAGSSLRDVGMTWSLTNARESSFNPRYQDNQRRVLRPVQTLVARFKDDAVTTDLKVGVAAGAWKEVAAASEGRVIASARDNITQSDVIYHPVQEKDGSLVATATHFLGWDYDCRIVAEDENHKVFEPARYDNSGGKMRLCTSVLNVPLAQVKWFRLQARPYKWVEFENIRLIPASTTLNRGESSSAPTVAMQAPADVAAEEQGKPVSPPSATGQANGGSSSVRGATPSVVMQWPVSQGGNGHFYQVVCVTKGLTWDEANAAAQAQGGYLATITSAEENAFIFALMQDLACWNGPRGPWIGGYQTPGRGLREGWHWVTGEPFVYSPWSPGQPNDAGGVDETRLEYGWGATTPADTWNDQPDWFQGVYSYVVEKEPGGPMQAAAKLNAWVSLQVLEERVVVLDTLKPFSDYWPKKRHQVVGALSEKETLDYLRRRLQDKESLPIRIHVYFAPETRGAAEDLRQQIFTLAREANAERDTDVRLEPSAYVGSGESPFYLREGKITTFYPHIMPRPDGGPKPITSGLVEPDDLEQHILWRLTMPKNLPLTFRIEYDEASSPLARQVADTAKAVAQRAGLADLVGVTGALVDPVPESAFLGKWQTLGNGVIQSLDIQSAGVCQVTMGEGSEAIKPGTSVKGTWAWTVKEVLLDINDHIRGSPTMPSYVYRATVNGEGNLVIQRGEIWPQGSFMQPRPPEMIFKKVQ